ncbi:malignant fibrous histiocytoma-amplified sequence 1 homolog [Corythoichthys intestinalis]|uniref:malignant fibrous histiocytoma-amplified sequence 1 homolog n=1 Tax=Corythoichthys intestinalis TaxID=161448 RepID=UPI0025A5EFBE|nr:malignant fibrous histiocytoma-amplified sequence 1 homolog [Corythoichthys intestinalis]XP_061800505.1 malignant fibrous histiocytoma-amplified sequence 1 homolog [Nerophis lumbriciformis]
MRTLNGENKERESGEGEPPLEKDVDVARLWRDAALRSRKLRSHLRQAPPRPEEQDLSQVETLNLGNNLLQDLPQGLASSLDNLRVLVLRRNRFSSVPRAVLELPRLAELDLSHNRLRGVADGLAESLPALKKLNLAHNSILQLPERIAALALLEELDVSFNELRSLPASFADLAGLRALDLDHNRLAGFPPEIPALAALEELDCSGNSFDVLPQDVARLNSVKILWLSNLELSSLPDAFCQLRRLESLMLDGNHLATLPPAFGTLRTLKMINLSSNRLDDFPDVLLDISGLEELYLSRNRLTRVPSEIARLRNLVNLWLDHNRLTYLPDSLVDLAKLEELLLQGNQIAVLPDRFGKLSGLNVWKAEGNPLVQPPYEVCAKGIAHIAAYQRDLARSRPEARPRLNVVLLGPRDAGKTWLRQILLDGGGPDVGAERGIHVSDWAAAEGDPAFRLYDVSAESELDPVRPLFLSPAALYILAINLRSYSPRDFYARVGYFLRLLGSKVPRAVVLLVGTRTDLCVEAELEEKKLDIHRQVGMQETGDARVLRSSALKAERALRRGYPARASGPRGYFYAVSDGNLRREVARLRSLLEKRPQILSPLLSDVRRLREKLVRLARNTEIFPELQRAPPGSWQTLEKLHLDSKEPWLTRKDSARLGRQAGLTEDGLQSALSYRRRAGTLMHWEHDPVLEDYIFHDVPRFIGIIDAFLPRERRQGEDPELDAFRYRGLLPAGAVHRLLRPVLPEPGDPDSVMDLLEKIGFCYCVNKPRDGEPPNGGAELWYKFPGCEGSGAEPGNTRSEMELNDGSSDRELHGSSDSEPEDGSSNSDLGGISEPEPDGSSDPGPDASRACPLSSAERLEIRYSFPFLFPPGLFARFCARINRHVARRWDGRRRVLAYRGKVPVAVSHRLPAGGRPHTLSVGSQAALPNMWTAWQAVAPLLSELDALLGDWPGLHYQKHILCAKCLRRGSASPHAFPGELLSQRRPEGVSELMCPKHLSERVNVALIYPPTPADTPPTTPTAAPIGSE